MKRRRFLRTSASLAFGLTAQGALFGHEHVSDDQRADEDQLMSTQRMHAMPDYSPTGVQLITDSTPAADGFHFPAEWTKHELTIMQLLKARLAKHLDIPMYPVDVCMEGGGVVLDGDDTLITTSPHVFRKRKKHRCQAPSRGLQQCNRLQP